MIARIFKKVLRLFCATIFISAMLAFSSGLAFESKSDWEEYRSTHFIIHYHTSIPDDYIKEFSRKCENYYHLITARLGFSRFSFWLWEDRVKIFIYKTQEEYIKDARRPKWSGASVHIRKKFINTFYFAEDFFDKILPHELAHIILREFIGLTTKAPLWLDEGVACANEKDGYATYLLLTKELLERKSYMPLPELERANEKGVNFPGIFYPSAASVVIFLLENYGQEDFADLCRHLRDGGTFYGSMDKVYGIKDAEDLDKKFLTFLTNKSYEDIVKMKGRDFDW